LNFYHVDFALWGEIGIFFIGLLMESMNIS